MRNIPRYYPDSASFAGGRGTALPSLSLLPFLDIIFATIGIFIVVFALQQIVTQASGRQLTVDHLVICADGQTVTFYPGPTREPVMFTSRQFPALMNDLAESAGGVRNLVFAFTGACFEARRTFEEEFAKMTALFHARQADRADQTVFRLAFQPLSAQPGAVERLLAAWRGGSSDDTK
jgi:hypothetical protein